MIQYCKMCVLLIKLSRQTHTHVRMHLMWSTLTGGVTGVVTAGGVTGVVTAGGDLAPELQAQEGMELQ